MKWLKSGGIWGILSAVVSAGAGYADILPPKAAAVLAALATVVAAFSKQPHKPE